LSKSRPRILNPKESKSAVECGDGGKGGKGGKGTNIRKKKESKKSGESINSLSPPTNTPSPTCSTQPSEYSVPYLGPSSDPTIEPECLLRVSAHKIENLIIHESVRTPNLQYVFFSQVDIDCVAFDGTPCEDLSPPPGSCSVGSCSVGNKIEVAKFKVTDCTCDRSFSTQFDNFVCEDTGTAIPPEGTPVLVSCARSDGTVFFEETSPIGSTIEVTDSANPGLPDVMTCTMIDEPGNELQTFTVNTSGDVDFFLKDKYGMLQVEACEVENMLPQVCIVPLTYTYTVTNVGGTDMDINVLERTRNSVTVDLLDQVSGANWLAPGDTASTTEEENLDICVDGVYKTPVVASANRRGGAPCFDTDEFIFEIVNSCIPQLNPLAGSAKSSLAKETTSR
jgi:hypothetical protein